MTFCMYIDQLSFRSSNDNASNACDAGADVRAQRRSPVGVRRPDAVGARRLQGPRPAAGRGLAGEGFTCELRLQFYTPLSNKILV